MMAIFLDIETTGLDPWKHRVIDIAFKIIDLSCGELKVSYQRVVKQPSEIWNQRDLVSMQINGYTWEQVSNGIEPEIVGQEIVRIFTDLKIERGMAVFICQNPGFDRSLFSQLVETYMQEKLNWPYHWLDLASMYWVVFYQKKALKGEPMPRKMSLSKNDIATEYQLPIETIPHLAINGVNHLIQCYQAVLGATFSY